MHIDNRKYSMYGLNIGDALISVDSKINFPHDESFEVLNDVVEGTSSAWFYCNTKKGDCMVVIFNEVSNRVVAMTYFSDGEKVTEQLTGPAW